MSHIVEIKTQVRDPAAACAACQRLGLALPIEGKAKLFTREAEGLIVQLPGWNYPVVFDVSTGEARYDNFEGRWGEQQQINTFLQAYAVEKTKLESRRKGHAVSEQQLVDGSIKLSIQAGGAA